MKRFSLIILVLLGLALAACQAASPAGSAITGTDWKMVELNGSAPLAGRDVTLKIDGTEVGGNAGCNSYGGKASIDGTNITFSELMQTEMACMDPAGIMDQETTYMQTLMQAASFSASGDRLEMKNVSGETILAFTK